MRQRLLRTILGGAAIAMALAGSASALSGNHPLVVILCKFTDQTNEPHQAPYYQNMFSETAAGQLGVFDFWRDVSYGNLDLTGTVVKGWYTAPKTAGEFNVMNRADQIDVCASQAVSDVDFNKFAGVVVLTNHTNLNGPLFGGPPPTTIKGTTYPSLGRLAAEEDQELNGILHETGHALGVEHSRSLENDPTGQTDYGDLYDIGSCLDCFGMFPSYQGNGGPGVNAVQLETAGWLPGNRVIDVGTSACAQQTIQLAALNHPEVVGYLAARTPAAVPIFTGSPSATTGDHYMVELRDKSGWDEGIPRNGVLIHLHGQDGFSYWAGRSGAWGTFSGSAASTSRNFRGLMLAGDQYADAAKQNFYVAVNSIDAPGHTAVVTIGARDPNAQGNCKIDASLAYSGATSGDFNDLVTLAADLRVSGTTAPVPEVIVSFKLGTQSCASTTDANGHAACAITLNQHPGAYNVSVSYAGGTAYDPASASAGFTITREETTTAYTGPLVILQGKAVTLTGRLLEDGVTPIQGRTLTLRLGAQSCSGTTDANGDASCTLVVAVSLGPQMLAAEFAGDPFYLPSSDASRQAVVFAFPARGAFVLGSQTAAAATPSTTLTWWSYSWTQQNSLSGGAVNPSFKGFANALESSPPACGAAWKTSPGDSSDPPGSVPSYMGVLVSSSVTMSGSTFSGNIAKIVVVLTQPGYGPNPGSPGTGTVVATYCP